MAGKSTFSRPRQHPARHARAAPKRSPRRASPGEVLRLC